MSKTKKERIYLDNNAGAPLDPRIAASLTDFINQSYGNPSSLHGFGQDAKALLNHCRKTAASFLKVQPHEILFTSGGSEAMNFLIKGVLDRSAGGHIITSNVEHASVQRTVKSFERKGFRVSYLPAGLTGAVNIHDIISALQEDTRLITLMAVNNETGVKNDIEAIAKIAKDSCVPFIVDAVSLLGKEVFSIPEGVSAMGFSGHKIHALQGVGAAFVRSRCKLTPLIEGGSQEYGLRGGTENLLGILSFAEAIELLKKEMPQSILRMQALREKLERELIDGLSGIHVNGKGHRIANTSNIAFSGVDGESLLIALDQEGIAVSHGSACSSGSRQPSQVLLNMGIPLDLVRSSIRFSLSKMTTEDEIGRCVSFLKKLIPRLKR